MTQTHLSSMDVFAFVNGDSCGNYLFKILKLDIFFRRNGDGGKSSPDDTLGRRLEKYPRPVDSSTLTIFFTFYILYIIYIIIEVYIKKY